VRPMNLAQAHGRFGVAGLGDDLDRVSLENGEQTLSFHLMIDREQDPHHAWHATPAPIGWQDRETLRGAVGRLGDQLLDCFFDGLE